MTELHAQQARKADRYASLASEAPRWYAVAIQPGAETTAIEHAARQGFALYVATRRERVTNWRGKAIGIDVRKPRFPGYAFVLLDINIEQWRAINGTRGVRYLLPRNAEFPIPLPHGFVEWLQAQPEADETDAPHEYAEHDMVRIIAGPFASRDAEVISQDKGRIRARLSDGLAAGAIVTTTTDAVELNPGK